MNVCSVYDVTARRPGIQLENTLANYRASVPQYLKLQSPDQSPEKEPACPECTCESVATIMVPVSRIKDIDYIAKALRTRLVIAPTMQCLLKQQPSESSRKQESGTFNDEPRSFWRQHSHQHRRAVSCQTCPWHWHPLSSPASILGHS